MSRKRLHEEPVKDQKEDLVEESGEMTENTTEKRQSRKRSRFQKPEE